MHGVTQCNHSTLLSRYAIVQCNHNMLQCNVIKVAAFTFYMKQLACIVPNRSICNINSFSPCRVGLVVSVSVSHKVGRGFASQPGHTKDHH